MESEGVCMHDRWKGGWSRRDVHWRWAMRQEASCRVRIEADSDIATVRVAALPARHLMVAAGTPLCAVVVAAPMQKLCILNS